jgi:hypothetical protein
MLKQFWFTLIFYFKNNQIWAKRQMPSIRGDRNNAVIGLSTHSILLYEAFEFEQEATLENS